MSEQLKENMRMISHQIGGYKEVEFKLNNLKSKREPSRKGGVEKYNNENAKFTGGGWSKQI